MHVLRRFGVRMGQQKTLFAGHAWLNFDSFSPWKPSFIYWRFHPMTVLFFVVSEPHSGGTCMGRCISHFYINLIPLYLFIASLISLLRPRIFGGAFSLFFTFRLTCMLTYLCTIVVCIPMLILLWHVPWSRSFSHRQLYSIVTICSCCHVLCRVVHTRVDALDFFTKVWFYFAVLLAWNLFIYQWPLDGPSVLPFLLPYLVWCLAAYMSAQSPLLV